MFSKAESANVTKRQQKYVRIARASLVPIATCLLCAWVSLNGLNGSADLYPIAQWLFRAAVLMTFAYAVVVLIFYL
jgi:hypothetical protein